MPSEQLSANQVPKSEARQLCELVVSSLQAPWRAPRALMRGADIGFPSVVSGCYFQGRLSERGTFEIGLRKPGLGRELDLIRCVAGSASLDASPDLVVKLVGELLVAPWYMERRGGIEHVASGGVWGYLEKQRRSGYYRSVYMVVRGFAEAVLDFVRNEDLLLGGIKKSPASADLLYQELTRASLQPQLAGILSFQNLVSHLKEKFDLRPTKAQPTVIHSVTGEDVRNTVSSEGFENDMAKRLIELSSLKRILIPVRGVPVTALLITRQDQRGRKVFERVLCQGLRFNPESPTYETLVTRKETTA